MRLLLLLVSLLPLPLLAQEKRPLTHRDYDGWKSIRATTLSPDGRWAACSVVPQVGDGELLVLATDGSRRWRVPRGSRPRFAADGRFVVFRIEPPLASQLAAEWARLEKGKGASGKARKPPQPALGLLHVPTGRVETIPDVSRFEVPRKGPALVVYEKHRARGGKPASAGTAKKRGGEKKPKPYHRDGRPLHVRYRDGRGERVLEGVTAWGLSRDGRRLWYAANSRQAEPPFPRGLFVLDLLADRITTVVAGAADFRSVQFDRAGRRLAFLSNRRLRDEKQGPYDLYLWETGAPAARIVVTADRTPGFPEGQRLAPQSPLRFSRDGSALLFGIAPPPPPELPPTLPRYRVTLDIWHWRDRLLQPMQARQAARLRNAARAAVWHGGTQAVTVLARHRYERVRFLTDDGTLALATDSWRYAREISWDGRYLDAYVVRTLTGRRERVARHHRGNIYSSPDGRYLLLFRRGHWWARPAEKGPWRSLTRGLPVRFVREDWDTPQPPAPYGIAGWTRRPDGVVLYDRYDLWFFPLPVGRARCVTGRFGRQGHLRLRYVRLEREARFIPVRQPLLLAATDTETMDSGYYRCRFAGGRKPERLLWVAKMCLNLKRARRAERYLLQFSRFDECPDLWSAGPKLRGLRRLTHINPQQRRFRWGRAELVRWYSADGVPLKGILIKPEDFDPKKKYPLMVYFYERLSRQLHRYRPPAPGTSPNPTYYVSNGYLWFMPDIVYRPGYPGESCLKCVVPGVQKLIEQGFVDPQAIGVAGHSWGGYQVAYLVTRTRLFRAAEAGAPVSNMVSAYGGIRWRSGMSRAFQYERTQSRIGGSLWRYPLRFLENSPIFFADKIRTPLLILHNDQDGAVPWYQSIELFCALRRLNREVYLFNYNGAPHGLRRRAEQMDWTIRMQQFFDHHLRGKPAPEWMRRGVPYLEREREKYRFLPPPARPKPGAAKKKGILVRAAPQRPEKWSSLGGLRASTRPSRKSSIV